MAKLFKRNDLTNENDVPITNEDIKPVETVSNLVHGFLIGACTIPGVGLSYTDGIFILLF